MAAEKTKEEHRADLRADLIRRLFAVAISVGFATTLARMEWVKNGTWPNTGEWQQLCILATAMIATVLSWDGYFMSIEEKPLLGFWRFAIDITLVFIYMFLLITSNLNRFWLPILSVIFSLYVLWDFLTVREHVSKYNPKAHHRPASIAHVLSVYWLGFLNSDQIRRGPIITLSWAMCFLGLAIINSANTAPHQFIMCAIATAGLILYRSDKTAKQPEGVIVGYRMERRAALVAFLLIVAAFDAWVSA